MGQLSVQSCRRQRRIKARRAAKRSSGLDARIPKPRPGVTEAAAPRSQSLPAVVGCTWECTCLRSRASKSAPPRAGVIGDSQGSSTAEIGAFPSATSERGMATVNPSQKPTALLKNARKVATRDLLHTATSMRPMGCNAVHDTPPDDNSP
jgi:hypothetical protein